MACRVNFSQTSESRTLNLSQQRAYNSLFANAGKSSLNRKQNIVSLNKLVIGNRQVCLECKGIVQFNGGKFVKLQDMSKAYNHKPNCSQIGKF